jgi:prepilin signal peptidase PulO-like enzyme (type II secretory pathway)
LGGKCRYCAKKISWQYPLVELATGIIFVLFFLKYFSPALLLESKNWNLEIFHFLGDLFFASILIFIFVYDLRYYLVSDKIIISTLIFILLFNLVLVFLGGEPIKLFLNLILAGLIGGAFFLIQFLISNGKWVGGGDIRLGLIMGLMLGLPGIIIALIMAYISGAIIGIILIILKIKKMKSLVPFGPFLSFATLVTVLYGEKILVWYREVLIFCLIK